MQNMLSSVCKVLVIITDNHILISSFLIELRWQICWGFGSLWSFMGNMKGIKRTS